MTVVSDKIPILGNRFLFIRIVAIFLVTVTLLGSLTSVLGQNATVPNVVNETVVDNYDYYAQPIYYNEDSDDDSNGGNNYYYKDESDNNYYTNAQGQNY